MTTRTRLPNGLPVYGATRSTVRLYQLVLDYFESGVRPEPGMTVVDVGANIGLFSLEVLQRCGGEVELLAFEPAPEPFADLERNVAVLFPDADARVFRCALADRPGDTVLYYRPLASGLSSLERDGMTDERRLAAAMLRPDPPAQYRGVVPPWLRRLPRPVALRLVALTMRQAQRKVVAVPCPVKTLSQVIEEQSLDAIDLLKVDVEGAELDVLEGIDEADWPRIGAIAIEVHDVEDRVRVVRGMLESHGFDDVEVSQEWIFESTDVYMLFASRD
jgi:FkbM family methyltransferase